MTSDRSMPRRTAIRAAIPAFFATAARGINPRQFAPRFTARTIDGVRMDNDALKGKVVLVQFWATWCRYCRADQPVVDTLTREFTPRGLVVLAVDVGESREKVTQYLKKSPRACQVVLMEDTNLAAVFAAQAYPHYVVIDRDGRIVGSQTGAAGAVPLRRLLGQAGLGR